MIGHLSPTLPSELDSNCMIACSDYALDFRTFSTRLLKIVQHLLLLGFVVSSEDLIPITSTISGTCTYIRYLHD